MTRIGIFFSILAICCSPAYSQPSFDCGRASTEIERLICATPELGRLDRAVAQRYKHFLDGRDASGKHTATLLQRLWLKSRDQGCRVGAKYEADELLSFTGPPEGIPVRIAKSDETEKCLKNYYREAIAAFDRGVLLSRVYLFDAGVPQEVPVSVAGIRSAVFHRDDIPEHEDSKGHWSIILDGGDVVKAQSSHNRSQVYLPYEIRFYMLPDGSVQPALMRVEGYYSGGSECVTGHVVTAHFLGPHIAQGTALKETDEHVLRLVDATYCRQSYETWYHDWLVDEGKLGFIVFKTSQGPFYNTYITELGSGGLKTRPYMPDHLGLVSGIPIQEIVAQAEERAEQRVRSADLWAIRDPKGCETVINDISRAYGVYSTVREHRLGVGQILATLSNDTIMGNYRKAAGGYADSAAVFLSYLAHIQSVPAWERKLSEVDDTYEWYNSSHRRYSSYQSGEFDNPFQQAGFPKKSDCLLALKGPSYASTEEWILNFWKRRYKDGSLELARRLLEMIVSSAERKID